MLESIIEFKSETRRRSDDGCLFCKVNLMAENVDNILSTLGKLDGVCDLTVFLSLIEVMATTTKKDLL